MLVADGGGGYAGSTNWHNFDTREIWLRLANQDTEPYWQQVSAWKKTADLSMMHLSRLKQYRDGLAEAWPPEKNEAARAYVERLDYLIDVVQGVYDASSTNHQTLSNITLAISEARRNLEPIVREYEEKQRAKKDYEDTNPLLAIFKTEVTQSDLNEVDIKARRVMYSLSGELAGAQMRLEKPPPYTKGGGREHTEPDGNVMGGSTPPVLPPVPVPGGGGGPTYTSSPTPAVQTVVPTPITPGAGPILGGIGTPTPPTVSPTPSPIITPSPPPGPGLSGPFPPPTGGLPPGTRPPGLPPTGYPNSSNLGGGPAGPKTGLGTGGGLTPRAMPPGGMIGGTPGSGLTQPASGAGAARRINPIGGVIGGGGPGGTPVGGAGQRPGMGGMSAGSASRPGAGIGRTPISSGQNFGVPPSSRTGNQRQDEENSQHWDPDNPWDTDEGVAPVMMPSRQINRIDPGPAIGYNR